MSHDEGAPGHGLPAPKTELSIRIEYLTTAVSKVESKLDLLPRELRDEFVSRYEFEALNKELELLNSTSVTRVEFEPYKSLIRGLVAAVLLGVLGAILALIMSSGGGRP